MDPTDIAVILAFAGGLLIGILIGQAKNFPRL